MSVIQPRLGIVVAVLAGTLEILAASTPGPDPYAEPQPPRVWLTPTPAGLRVDWSAFPAAERYQLERSPEAGSPFEAIPISDTQTGAVVTASGDSGIYRLRTDPLSTNDLLAVTVLSRLAYGPTPDELDRVRSIGPDAYIEEQLSPETLDQALPHDVITAKVDGWEYVTATGTGSSSAFYIYLGSVGEGYVDDMQLVAGPTAGVGDNLLRNGDFESPLVPADWTKAANLADSDITTAVARSGRSSLHVRATAAGASGPTAIVQQVRPGLSANQTYTLSYWWRASESNPAPLTVRLSGSGISSSPVGTLRDRLVAGKADIPDLRAWHSLNAVYSRRQLLEVLLQFVDNHFVTQHSKSLAYFNPLYPNYGERFPATLLEFNEMERWRAALLRPDCTFHDLLRISAESPAMIIYLDSVDNRGGKGDIANENYARELLELFTFGVDNGYDQRDIEELARVWTGWSVRYVAPDQELNPFAPRTTLLRPGAPAGSTQTTNLIGVWSFAFKREIHDPGAKHLFFEHDPDGALGAPKTYPARFGPKYSGKPYGLLLPGAEGTNGITEGHAVLGHLANQPFTQEFLVVKLCRLFVHDDFHHGTYDYTAEVLPPEAALVKSCMDAWDSTEPKGQIRVVLRTLFNSELFRRHGASQHKIKTPLEFAASTLRALMAKRPDGAPTAVADGYGLRHIMQRSGNMDLFNRADPDGFPETAPPLVSAGTLAERLRFVQAFLMPLGFQAKAEEAGDNRVDPVGFVRIRLPQSEWKDAAAVANLFLRYLFPAEGAANLATYREQAIWFLNTRDDDSGVADPFSGLSTTGNPSPYETRLRGMVALLFTLPRFQEQ